MIKKKDKNLLILFGIFVLLIIFALSIAKYSITFYIDPEMLSDPRTIDIQNIDISYIFLDSKNG